MVFRVEESIATVCAPSPGFQAHLHVCQAVFESIRYLVYASESLLVVLAEAPPISTPSARDQTKRASRFELWQVWNAQDAIRCVRFNPSKKAARGALALCIDEGRSVLLMPASATSSRAAAVVEASRATTLGDTPGLARPSSLAAGSDLIPRSDYVKAHLHLHLPRWAESVRWKCDDRMLNHLEWVESGDDLFLLGAGEKLSIWKLVDDSVQVYLQRTVTLSGGGGPGVDTLQLVVPVCHFDVAPSGRFAATAGKHDRIVKLWNLGELSPHEGAPMSMFLPHARALVSMTWSKDVNVYNARSTVTTTTGACEMLFTLDRVGNISIWRETVAPLRSFVLWKQFAAMDLCLSPLDDENDMNLESRIREFGLVNHYWARGIPKTMSSINEALLSENTVMDALCLFHYGYGSLNDARRNEVVSQRMDSITQMNAKLLGDRSGAVADTPVGEKFICGNVALEKTFAVNLVYGVLSNGDFCIFRAESIPFTGVSPKLSLLLSYSDLREQLIDAHLYNVSSSDFQDQENDSTGFFIEVLFQRETAESYLHCARLKLQVESSSVGTRTGSIVYSVQSCEVCAVCSSMMSAKKEGDVQVASLSVANMISRPDSQADAGGLAMKIVTTNMGGRLNVFRASGSLRRLKVAFRSKFYSAVGPVTHTASYEKRGVLYLFIGGKLHVAMVTPGGTQQVSKTIESSSSDASGIRRKSSLAVAGRDALTLTACYMDESYNSEELNELVVVDIPESVKVEWSNSSLFFSQAATNNSTKDYNMVAGVHKDGKRLTIWVFLFEITLCDSLTSSVQLFRKTTVDIPDGARLLSVASPPLLNTFEVTIASFDTDSQLTLWTFADLDTLMEMKPAHRVDVGALMRMASQAQRSHMEFHLTDERVIFKHFSFSSCGRVAILFGGDESDAEDKICFLPTMESSLEGVVEVPRKQFGQVVSLEWTPPVTPERDCELLFLSTTTIGMLKFDCSLPSNKWSIAWSSSRFSVRPEKISSLSSYPYGLLRIGSSLAHLNLRDIDGVGSSPLQPPFTSPVLPRLSSQPPSKAFPAHHPITLMYLLARGSFETLEKVLEHVKLNIMEHEETCYLRMTNDTALRTLPLLSLSQLLGAPSLTENLSDERSDVYLRGKEKKSNGGTRYGTVSTTPVRASDLFAMDFGASRRYGASAGGADRASMLFAPQTSSQVDSPASQPGTTATSKLQTDVFSKFFNEHKSTLKFMTRRESEVFLTIVAGIKRIVRWERDSSRQKDEAALRFLASLLWPVDPPGSELSTQSLTTDSNGSDQQRHNGATVPTSNHQVAGLCSEQVAWGALSDFQPELLQECFPAATMSWKEMRRLRLPFWLKSSAKLIQFTEKVAQTEFAANRDPFAVAVFYVLLGKTRLLASLFQMASESRISELLCNNFSDLRWKKAAIKNAYVLKTKQRYELSAAFFLLGGKVTEAVSVAEQADETLVLSFLIARISGKWDLGGHDNSSNVAEYSPVSLTGLSTNLRGLAAHSGPKNLGLLSDDEEATDAKKVCADFLNTTVWEKASKCGDLYMCFLVKYFLGETSKAIDLIVTPPTIEMRSMFGDWTNSNVELSSLYWSAFGKSLVGACDLLRFLRKTVVLMNLALKEKMIRLNTSAMLRMQDAGLGIPALIHQRDAASFLQDFRRERATSSEAAAFLACRQRVLIAAVGNQVDFLYATFLKSMREAMTTPATSATSTRFDLEERLNEEIQCIVRHGGDYALSEVPETSKEHLEHRVRAAVMDSLVHSGRLAALDFLVSGWGHSSPTFAFTSPLPRFVEVIAEGVATVASGNLMSAATDYLHTRKVDQTCSNLLTMATRLLLWLQYFYLKPAKQRATLPNREFVRIAVAAVHSAICICCRYLKNPCCLYRVFGLIFPHKHGLSANSVEILNDIANGEICGSCASLRRSTSKSSNALGASSLQQDIPVLYQAVCMLEQELDEFTAAVKTSRLHHPMSSRGLPTPVFSYCSYWGLVLMMAAGAMPAHLLKMTGEGIASTAELSKKLVEAWRNYGNRLAGFALKHLLCDLAGFFFSPFSIAYPPTSPGAASSATSPGSSRGSSSPSRSGTTSPRAFPADTPGSPPSPQRVNRRQLLKCECEFCPWLLLVELFTNKNELLLRLNAQLECCSEKLDEEVRWGRLPEPASRKSALTRSQKLLLSTVAENAPTFSRAANLTDQLKRRMAPMSTTAAVHVQCVYRSETNIKAMCFNRAAGEDAEVSVCSSKGIFRASCMDYADGSRFQFKGMYAPPQASFFSSDPSQPSPVKRRQTPDAMHSSSSSSTSLSTRSNGPASPLRNPAHLLASPSEPNMASFKPTAMASHPFLPLFVSGNHKGRVHLWSYDRLSAICAFQTKDLVAPYPTSPSMLSGWRSVKALEFDSLGQQLGAVDAVGHLFLWKFSELNRVPYYREIVCHDKGAKGLTFLNSSSSVATVGTSSEKRNVCVWDTLLPTSKALVAAPACHPAGATSIAFSSTHQLLITGGAGGALSIFDLRQRRVLHTISNAHETPIKTIVMHPSGDCVLSGSAGGDVKIWSLPIFREVAFLSKVHVKPSFLGDAASNLLGDAASNVAINVTNSSWGVTDAVAMEDAFFTSGTDGSVQRLKVPSLGTRL